MDDLPINVPMYFGFLVLGVFKGPCPDPGPDKPKKQEN